ncbi:hypothetical protein [Flavobacterium microcysteis]
MKKIITCLFLTLVLNSCKSQKKEFTILGKWQAVEYSGSDGAKVFTNKISNGEIFIFEMKNVVKDKLGNTGTYTFQNNKLHIELAEQDKYYTLSYDEINPERIFLDPVTSDYQIICDEGCSFTFEKQ